MKIRPARRIIAAAGAVILAAFVAAGCGGSSGAGKAAVDSDGLGYVGKNALLYIVFDTDFEGKSWDQAESHLENFDSFDKAKKDVLKEVNSDDEDVKWDDIDEWLGDEAGLAITDLKGEDEDPEFIAWFAVEDEKKATSFLKKEGEHKSAGSHEGYKLYSDDDVFYTMKDGMMVLSSSKKGLKGAIDTNKNGKSITELDGIKDVAKEASGDSLVTMVISGKGIAEAIKSDDDADPQAEAVLKGAVDQLDALYGVSVSLRATEDGFNVHAFAGYNKDKMDSKVDAKTFKPTMVEGLPKDTMLALSASNLGGTLKQGIETMGKSDPSMAQQIAGLEGALGFTLDDLADGFDGQFAVAAGSTAAAGGMIPPINMLSESGDPAKAKKVFDGIMKIAGAQTGSAPTSVTVGDAQGQVINLGLAKVAAAVVDDTAVVTTDPLSVKKVIDGDGGLGDSDEFEDAAEAADMPDEVAGLFWLDTQKALGFAKALGTDTSKIGSSTDALGPLLGWSTAGDESSTFDMFMMIEDTN